MCVSCILGSIRLIVYFTNSLHALLGLTVLGYGVYTDVNGGSMYSMLMMAVGGFVFVSALIGIIGVYKNNKCLLFTYGLGMLVLILVNIALLIMTIKDISKLLGSVSEKNKNWLESKDHEQLVEFLFAGLIGIELLCLVLGCVLYRNKNTGTVSTREKIIKKRALKKSESISGADYSPKATDKSNSPKITKRGQTNDSYTRIDSRHNVLDMPPRLNYDDL